MRPSQIDRAERATIDAILELATGARLDELGKQKGVSRFSEESDTRYRERLRLVVGSGAGFRYWVDQYELVGERVDFALYLNAKSEQGWEYVEGWNSKPREMISEEDGIPVFRMVIDVLFRQEM